MTIAAGSRLGPYEIVSALGAGGMGEVYRARDTRLGREVAVKVLPEHLSSSAEVRQRFEREARTISQLAHPHVCALYDVGREGDVEYLVMELLEGETLAQRLLKGALPLEQTLRFGTEIADALDKAHRRGIVHRDLKPGNVMLTRSGVKLLDFGLAKGMAAESSSGSLTALPTQQGLTQEGTILGTFQYMSPEQLEGKEADARSDIFAFGATLYEMATGRKAFSGTSQASLISAIMKEDPAPISSVQPMAPAMLDRLVRSCLAKDPDDRLQTAHDAMLELQWIAEATRTTPVPSVAAAPRRRRAALGLPWILFALAAVAAVALGILAARRPHAPEPVIRSSVLLPDRVSFQAAAVSPDGRRLIANGLDQTGNSRLWLRDLDSFKSDPIAGSERAALPFWSPDGRYIAFFADGKLKRLEPSGGSPLDLYDNIVGVGGAWGPGGDVLFAGPAGPILRLPPNGGKANAVTKLDEARHETSHRYPCFLPDGRHFLFTALNLAGSPHDEANRLYVGSLDGSTSKPVMALSTNAVYSEGYLLFMRGGVSSGSLLAQAFDPDRLELRGEPRVVAEAISANIGYYNYASFSASPNGVLVYDSTLLSTRLAWLDRAGRPLGQFGEPARYGFPRLSPNGSQIAFTVYDGGINKDEIWIADVARGARTLLTPGPAENTAPVWSPDASRIAYRSDLKHQGDLMVRSVSGGSAEETLSDEPGQKIPMDWSRDGRYILYFDRPAGGSRVPRLSAVPTFGERKPIVLYQPIADGFGDRARFSPDGRWALFATTETGRTEVVAISFPDASRKIQISNAGADSPRWRADGREIFFWAADGKVMAVEVQPGPDLRLGSARALFDLPSGARGWEVSPDGQRFLVNLPVVESNSVPLSLVVNWTAPLKSK